MVLLSGKYLGQVLERLELKRIAAGVQEKHRRLLPDLPLEPDMRFNHELRPGLDQFVGQCLPFAHRQDGTEMAHRHVIPVHRTGTAVTNLPRRQMCNDLVAVKIEIDPLRGGTTLRAAQQSAIKCAGLGQVINGKREVKKRLCHDQRSSGKSKRVFYGFLYSATVPMPSANMPVLAARGCSMPQIGFGTSQLGDCADLVAIALKLGYRHIDTAWKYGTEKGVGAGILASGVPRSEIFLVTKVSHEYLRAGDFARMVDESLRNLQVDYVDLLHVHWPTTDGIPLAETMEALARAKRQGLTRHIGIANFNIALMEEARQTCPEPLAVLQGEYHPYLDQSRLLDYCRRHDLIFTAYCPLARGRLFQDPVLADIARAKGKTIAQVVLRWIVQQGNIAPIPRSSNPERIAQNLDVFNFALNADEMKRIHALARPDGRIANPAGRAPAWD